MEVRAHLKFLGRASPIGRRGSTLSIRRHPISDAIYVMGGMTALAAALLLALWGFEWGVILLLPAAIFFGRVAFIRLDRVTTVRPDGLEVSTGRLWVRSRTVMVPFLFVHLVEVQQGPLQRIFQAGDLHVVSDISGTMRGLVFRGIRDPHRVKEALSYRVALALRGNAPNA